MHGLMPQLPVVRHARAVGPVPSTATAAALFDIEVGRRHGGRKKNWSARVNALLQHST